MQREIDAGGPWLRRFLSSPPSAASETLRPAHGSGVVLSMDALDAGNSHGSDGAPNGSNLMPTGGAANGVGEAAARTALAPPALARAANGLSTGLSTASGSLDERAVSGCMLL